MVDIHWREASNTEWINIETLSIKVAKVSTRKAVKPFVRPITTAVWSNNISFSSPEADFYATAPRAAVDPSVPTWSRSFSYASAESDFSDSANAKSQGYPWSNAVDHGAECLMSFVSPEADLTAEPNAPEREMVPLRHDFRIS